MGFVSDLMKNGLGSAVQRYFDKDRNAGEDRSRELAAVRNQVLNSGPVMTSRGIFHKTRQLSIEGPQGWKIDIIPNCASPLTKFEEGARNTYKTVQEAQENRCKPCPHCYQDHPKNLLGQL